jgi:hypothetical protein
VSTTSADDQALFDALKNADEPYHQYVELAQISELGSLLTSANHPVPPPQGLPLTLEIRTYP